MKQRILSVILALCLCISSQPVVYASQEAPSQQEDVFMEESANEPESGDDENAAGTEDVSQEEDGFTEESVDEPENSDDENTVESEDASQEEDGFTEESAGESENGGDEDAAEVEDTSKEEDGFTEESTDESESSDGDDENVAESEDTSKEDEELTEESADAPESSGDDENTAESEDSSQKEEDFIEESAADSDNMEDSDDENTDLPEENLSEDDLLQEEELIEEYADEVALIDVSELTPAGVHDAMIALKEQDAYKEGTTWTNDEPYSDSNYYRWHGGTLGGKNIVAVGCVAFAFILSDAAFGSLPARMYGSGKFTFEDIKVGDILRMNTDTHTVIVLEVNEAGVVVAEGNINTGNHQGKVHWGRTISKKVVMNDTSSYITRYPEGYVAPDDPEANELLDKGELDGGLIWNLTKAGTLTVSGNGAMPDFSGPGEQPWNNNSSQIRKVIIEDGVTRIGSSAFYGNGVLSAQISSSVKTIGNSAFQKSSLISVTIPSSVITIGDSAFRECEGLNLVNVFEGLETINQNAFRGCTSLISIDLPASIGEVGAGAFMECKEMINVSFASGSKQVKLGDNLFTRCWALRSVKLPVSADRIGKEMFLNCGMLLGAQIPQGVERIAEGAFASTGVRVVIIPDSVTAIETRAFADCSLTDIYFTGTEAQWNRVSKIADTLSVVAKATIHYNYVPPKPEEPDDNSKPGDNTGNNTGGNTGGNTGDNTGESTGGNTGGNTGDNTGNTTGGNSGSNTGNNSGSNTGSNTGGNSSGGSSGSSSSGSSSSSSSSSKKDNKSNQAQNTSANTHTTDGQWVAEDTGNTKGTGWKLKKDDGTYVAGTVTADADGNIGEQVAWAQVNGVWYAFGADGYADSGWVMDETAESWYYVDIDSGMQTGWHNDANDGETYFMDLISGKMLLGWNLIEGKWYYFNAFVSAPTWQRDGLLGDWIYTGAENHPFGAMFKGEMTPDGYIVDENGAWIG